MRVPWKPDPLRKGELFQSAHPRSWSSRSFPTQEVPDCVRVPCDIGLFKTEKANGQLAYALPLTKRIAITTILPNKSQRVLLESLLSFKEVAGCTRLLPNDTWPKDTMAITP